MTTVYIVMGSEDYGGDWVEKVFDTEVAAIAHVRELSGDQAFPYADGRVARKHDRVWCIDAHEITTDAEVPHER